MSEQLSQFYGPLIRQPVWLLDGVLRHEVMDVWGKVWPIIDRAVNRFMLPNNFTEAELRNHLVNGTMQLWVIYNGPDNCIAAVAITSILSNDPHFEDETVFEVPFVSGYGMKHWLPELFTTLKAYALSHDCKIMLGYGRPGWKRLIGFEDVGTTDGGIPVMARRLDEEH